MMYINNIFGYSVKKLLFCIRCLIIRKSALYNESFILDLF